MSDVSLSKAVRANLLSLQSTASAMAKTQNRLATGLKVNSALDNPTNFFTAASLNSRAADMSNLLDSMASGIKTIEAADNGLKSITKTVESMQSTLRQARQDKSFKTTSLELPTGTPTGSEQLTLTGGALSATKNISLANGSGPTSAVYSLDAADFQTINMTAGPLVFPARSLLTTQSPTTFAAGDTLDITLTRDGTPSTFTIGQSDVLAVGNGDSTIDDRFEAMEIFNAKFQAGGMDFRAVGWPGGSGLAIFDTSTPYTDGTTLSVSETVHDQGGAGTVTAMGWSLTSDSPASASASANYNPMLTLTIDGGPPTAIFLQDGPDGDSDITTIAELADSINTAYGSSVASINSTTGALEIRSSTTGAASSVKISGLYSPDGETGGLVESSVTGSNGGVPAFKSVDALVQEINSDSTMNTAVRASNDNGKLRIENLSTADMTLSGALGSSTIGGNDVRANLVKQFNELRDQLDKFADDASFNGINLLRGDKLKLTFNETGTSTIEIQAEDETGAPTSVNNTALGIEAALDSDFDSDDDIDARLDKMKAALDDLRSQSSTFGSNLSVVQNRQDFTKSMINTLETGAANLTLADTNEEAANLLALQTRQQLSSSALSMASQADQAVLRLF